MSSNRSGRVCKLATSICTLALLLSLAGPAAASIQPAASASSATLNHALAARANATRAVARSRRSLNACLRAHPSNCQAQRRALRRSLAQRALADKHLRSVYAHLSRSSAKETESKGGGSKHGTGSGSGGSTEETTTGGGGSITEAGSGAGATTESTGTTESAKTEATEPNKTEPEPVKTEPVKTEPEPSKTEPVKTEPEPAGAQSGFEMGVVAGSAIAWELPFIQKLGAHTARMEFAIGTPVSRIEPIVEAYAKAGIRPLLLAGFDGTMPSTSEARNLASWAADLGPGGSFWKGKTFPAGTAPTNIEFGNETSYSYQYSDTSGTSAWYSLASYATRAQTYAQRFKEAYEAVHAVNPSVGLLAQADDGDSGSSEWVRNMFLAVPNLGQMVAGWTIHPYGPEWQTRIDRMISQTQAAGAPSTTPIYVTEWGLSTDNGRCLEDNYGYNPCMTYQEAATTLQSTVSTMRARYGARLTAFYLFQARDQRATGTSTEREGYFGALQSNEQPKGAYTAAVQSLLSANP